jgi:hypothetical protein
MPALGEAEFIFRNSSVYLIKVGKSIDVGGEAAAVI